MKILSSPSQSSTSVIAVVLLLIFSTWLDEAMGGDLINLYVSNSGLNNIERYNSLGQGSVFAGGLAAPYGLAFDSTGNLYVANNIGVPPSVIKIDSQGHLSVFATPASDYSVGLAVDANNNVYVGNSHSGTIEKYSPTGSGTPFASGLGFTTGLAFDNNGNLFAADASGRRIFKIDAQGNTSLFASGGFLNNPYELAFDKQGNLYVANYSGNSVEKFNSAGTGSLFVTGLNFPMGIAFDQSGNLYVANHGNGSSSIELTFWR